MMQALVYTGPETLEMRDVPMPIPNADEALVQIFASGICGSDMHAFLGHDERRPAPLILGHEAAGIVIEGTHIGQRVTINPLVTCGRCGFCISGRNNLCTKRQIISMQPREGAFAQFVAIPEINLVAIPDSLSFDKAALAEPIACGWHAVRLGAQVAHDALDQAKCLVLGGGAIGLGAALVLRAKNAKTLHIVEPNATRRKGLVALGFDVFESDADIAPDYDLVVEAVGYTATRASASKLAKAGSVIVHIGLGQAEGGLDIRRMTLQEITFIGTYTYTPQDFRDAVDAIASGALGPLDWPELRPLSDGANAFAELKVGKVAAPKIILNPQSKGQ